MTTSNKINPDFGHWFAGFVDGEGHLGITRVGKSYRCVFTMQLRKDDHAILEEIQQTLGMGSIYDLPSYGKDRNGHPTTMLMVARKQDVIALRDIFLEFPLRAKKATDFDIWSKAVDEWKLHTNRWDTVSWDNMIALKQQLEESRKYVEDENGEDPQV